MTAGVRCYGCGKVLVTADEVRGGGGAPSGENFPTMIVPEDAIVEPSDGLGRLLRGACASPEEIVEYMTEVAEVEHVAIGMYSREQAEPFDFDGRDLDFND